MGILSFLFGSRPTISDDSKPVVPIEPPKSDGSSFLPHVELLPTGLDDIDQVAPKMWENKQYHELTTLYLMRWNKLEDEKCEDDKLFWIVKRNEILCSVMYCGGLGLEPDSMDYIVEFSGCSPDADGCKYTDKSLRRKVSTYLNNPDMFPCKICTSCYRKFFCDVIIEPK